MIALNDLKFDLSLNSAILLVIMGFFGFVAQFGVNQALTMEKAGPMAALNYI